MEVTYGDLRARENNVPPMNPAGAACKVGIHAPLMVNPTSALAFLNYD
jgi:hypothetical protein